MRPIIRVENLSKQYRIVGGASQATYATLRESITEALRNPFGRRRRGENREDSVVWALKDVGFDVRPGEVLGIIGRNGTGKSTLLKVLSRITEPTSGRVDLYGRVGSLLEVGTGFHPELSGRENIYLNGVILGMKRSEIERKFDEITAFSEVEEFIDMPVKHYSSGMYMRLAFAVAAHLEPEILIVDEVLAVGDAGFQKKCLGKMNEIGNQGRTVLFVSHNMQAVAQLTRRSIVMDKGRCAFDGPTDEAISVYNKLQGKVVAKGGEYHAKSLVKSNYLIRAGANTSESNGLHRWGRQISFEFELGVISPQRSLCFSFQVMNNMRKPICHFWLFDGDLPYREKEGTFTLKCTIPKLRLYMGEYTLRTWLSERAGGMILESVDGICPFEVTMDGISRGEYAWQPEECAYIDDAEWKIVEWSITSGVSWFRGGTVNE